MIKLLLNLPINNTLGEFITISVQKQRLCTYSGEKYRVKYLKLEVRGEVMALIGLHIFSITAYISSYGFLHCHCPLKGLFHNPENLHLATAIQKHY